MTTSTVPGLFSHLAASGGQPRLTWYGVDGERVELSGHVLMNWSNKASNLLLEEFEAEPGMCISIDLPPHWRALYWALGIWQVGAEISLRGATPTSTSASTQPSLAITVAPERWTDSNAQVLAVALPALARRYVAPLPAGVLDAAASLMTYGDRLGWVPPMDPDAVALNASPAVAYADLPQWWADHSPDLPDGSRVLLEVTATTDLTDVIAACAAVWSSGGSVVLRELAAENADAPGEADLTAETEETRAKRARLLESEHVTATVNLIRYP